MLNDVQEFAEYLLQLIITVLLKFTETTSKSTASDFSEPREVMKILINVETSTFYQQCLKKGKHFVFRKRGEIIF